MAVSPDLLYMESACVCAGLAACTDLQSRRIPNWLTGSGFIAGLAVHLGLGGAREAGVALVAGLIGGGLFFVFFIAGGMGGGDVKLMAAVGCLAGLAPLRSILIATVLLGAVGALVTAALGRRLRETFTNAFTVLAHHQKHGLVSHPDLHAGNPNLLRLPYALPIAGGCLLTLLMHLHGGPVL